VLISWAVELLLQPQDTHAHSLFRGRLSAPVTQRYCWERVVLEGPSLEDCVGPWAGAQGRSFAVDTRMFTRSGAAGD